MYVEFTQVQTRGVARGAGNVLFVLYKLVKPFYANLADYKFIHETPNKVEVETQLLLKLFMARSPNVQGSLSLSA